MFTSFPGEGATTAVIVVGIAVIGIMCGTRNTRQISERGNLVQAGCEQVTGSLSPSHQQSLRMIVLGSRREYVLAWNSSEGPTAISQGVLSGPLQHASLLMPAWNQCIRSGAPSISLTKCSHVPCDHNAIDFPVTECSNTRWQIVFSNGWQLHCNQSCCISSV